MEYIHMLTPWFCILQHSTKSLWKFIHGIIIGLWIFIEQCIIQFFSYFMELYKLNYMDTSKQMMSMNLISLANLSMNPWHFHLTFHRYVHGKFSTIISSVTSNYRAINEFLKCSYTSQKNKQKNQCLHISLHIKS